MKEAKLASWETVEYTEDVDLPDVDQLIPVDDFLPSPAQLAQAEELVNVTISLSQESIDFFKQAAAERHVSYQTIIQTLLDAYVGAYQEKLGQPMRG
jgi:predicted DNA binding CopG/RHH family protein